MRKAALAALAIIILVLVFQNCSVGGDSAGMSDLGSSAPVGAPTITSDRATIVLATGSTNLSLTGRCSSGAFQNYYFEFGFKPSGTTTELTHRPSTDCNNGRYAVTISLSVIGITSGQAGTVTGRLVGVVPAGDTPSNSLSIPLSWSSSTGATTTGTTTGTTTTGSTTGSTTTGSTTGSTTGTVGGPCPAMTTNNACRCDNWSWPGSPVTRASAAECRAFCNSNNARCCEYHAPSGDCYSEIGNNCRLESGWSEWSSSVCN